MSKIIPRLSIVGIVLTKGSPFSFSQIRAPMRPVFFSTMRFPYPLMLGSVGWWRHHFIRHRNLKIFTELKTNIASTRKYISCIDKCIIKVKIPFTFVSHYAWPIRFIRTSSYCLKKTQKTARAHQIKDMKRKKKNNRHACFLYIYTARSPQCKREYSV